MFICSKNGLPAKVAGSIVLSWLLLISKRLNDGKPFSKNRSMCSKLFLDKSNPYKESRF